MEQVHKTLTSSSYLFRYFGCLGLFILLAFLFLAPYSFLWLFMSGDVSVDKVVAAQARGDFLIFGSGISQDFTDYKLRLYSLKKPAIVAIGSSRVMQFRGDWFKDSFLNMGGCAGNIAYLKATIDAMLKISRPKIVIIGVDFWWFLPQWEKNPDERVKLFNNSYNYGLNNLNKPWSWLFEGKISPGEFFAPVLGLFGAGFRADRYGIMAQQTDDGFGPDGSWYYTAEISGLKPPFDYQFLDTISQIKNGIKAFYHATPGQNGPAVAHLETFTEICCRLQSRGILTFVFIPPLSATAFDLVKDRASLYPHLFALKGELQERGIKVLDFSDPRTFSSSDCEFIDGFHGGEVTYARILRYMVDRWPKLQPYVNMDRLTTLIKNWQGNAMIPDTRVSGLPEIDFMNLNCHKKILQSENP